MVKAVKIKSNDYSNSLCKKCSTSENFVQGYPRELENLDYNLEKKNYQIESVSK